MLKPTLFLLFLLAVVHSAVAASTATNLDGRVLILENSTMCLPAAKATLILSPLTFTNGNYIGDFKVKVFPFFFKSDHGSLTVTVSNSVQAAFDQGKTVTITGTSVSAKHGTIRTIKITAMPKDNNHGDVTLWFMVGEQKMIFNTTYHFADTIAPGGRTVSARGQRALTTTN